MFNLLKALFGGSLKKKTADVPADDASTETKKCLRCLRRVDIDRSKCPHCRSEDFQY